MQRPARKPWWPAAANLGGGHFGGGLFPRAVAARDMREIRYRRARTKIGDADAVVPLPNLLVQLRILSDDPLVGVAGYNAKEDRRHDRRTLGIEDLRLVIESPSVVPTTRRMTGAARAVCYRLAVATGLRFAEIESITPESFDWTANPATVTVGAGYTKNGDRATLPLPPDLADDLRPRVAATPSGSPVFALALPRGGHAQDRPGSRWATLPRRLGACVRLP